MLEFLLQQRMDIYLLGSARPGEESQAGLDDAEILFCDVVVPGVVTEIYHGWTGGYPYHRAPLYGSDSNLPASTSFSKVVTDHGDPMCVH